jgi:ADP-heptose:LPS heptosyltransferase
LGIKRSLLELGVTAVRMVSRFRKPKEPLSILVLRNNDLGDLVAITPLFQVLRSAFPDARIVAAVCSWAKDILKNNPYISEVIDCNAPWHNHNAEGKSLLRPLRYIYRSPEMVPLKAENFDACIDVVGSPFGSLFMMKLGIPIRVGRKGYAGGHTGATVYLENTFTTSVSRGVVEAVRLLKSDADIDVDLKPQLFLDDLEIEEANQMWTEMLDGNCHRRVRIAVAPGAGFPEKAWPAAQFAELVGRLSKDSCGCVLGATADFAVGEMVTRGANYWSNLCGMTTLRRSMAIVSLADLVICPSTFLMHLASAFNKPCIVILTRAMDPRIHKFAWEIEGIHHQLFPSDGNAHVQVTDVEDLAKLLLEPSSKQTLTLK